MVVSTQHTAFAHMWSVSLHRFLRKCHSVLLTWNIFVALDLLVWNDIKDYIWYCIRSTEYYLSTIEQKYEPIRFCFLFTNHNIKCQHFLEWQLLHREVARVGKWAGECKTSIKMFPLLYLFGFIHKHTDWKETPQSIL